MGENDWERRLTAKSCETIWSIQEAKVQRTWEREEKGLAETNCDSPNALGMQVKMHHEDAVPGVSNL